MTGENGASDVDFFDNFNTEPDKQAVTEEVNRKLCEVLTELAENIVDVLIKAEDTTQRQMEGDFDGMAALAAYNDALAAIMQEKNVNSSAMCALPDEHPLKELFFSAFDPQMFHNLLERFISQVRDRKQGLGDWDAESAEGECDEDHTLE